MAEQEKWDLVIKPRERLLAVDWQNTSITIWHLL